MRLQYQDAWIRDHMLEGMTGLELEAHRVDREGNLAQTPHPFPESQYIDRDFSEAQMEINTPPFHAPEEALQFLTDQLQQVHRALRDREELLWPFSNPSRLRGEDDIPIARYEGDLLPSYYYRVYLAERYGKYKMTYSGIHFNYSFDEELLKRNQKLEQEAETAGREDQGKGPGPEAFADYRDRFYLRLAEKVLCYSWAVVALLAASPLVDNSFYEAGRTGETLFSGFSSLRCSEFGYWNLFLPILAYDSVAHYADSIEQYLEQGLLIQARELYYPVRVKPPGKYTLQALREQGINHIELRQIDLNPFAASGIAPEDLSFLKLLLVWLAGQDLAPLDQQAQMQALQNHKAAAGYDWDLARITLPGRKTQSLAEALGQLLEEMQGYYDSNAAAQEVLTYQAEKLQGEAYRYAGQVRAWFGTDYLGDGLRRAQEIQETFHV